MIKVYSIKCCAIIILNDYYSSYRRKKRFPASVGVLKLVSQLTLHLQNLAAIDQYLYLSIDRCAHVELCCHVGSYRSGLYTFDRGHSHKKLKTKEHKKKSGQQQISLPSQVINWSKKALFREDLIHGSDPNVVPKTAPMIPPAASDQQSSRCKKINKRNCRCRTELWCSNVADLQTTLSCQCTRH